MASLVVVWKFGFGIGFRSTRSSFELIGLKKVTRTQLDFIIQSDQIRI